MPCATPPSICPAASTRIDDLSDFLHGDEIVHANFGGAHVHGNFRHVHRPGVGAVGVAVIFFVVPVQIARLLILHEGFQRRRICRCSWRQACAKLVGSHIRRCSKSAFDSVCLHLHAPRDSTSLPTTMEVREATVGPLLGT